LSQVVIQSLFGYQDCSELTGEQVQLSNVN